MDRNRNVWIWGGGAAVLLVLIILYSGWFGGGDTEPVEPAAEQTQPQQ